MRGGRGEIVKRKLHNHRITTVRKLLGIVQIVWELGFSLRKHWQTQKRIYCPINADSRHQLIGSSYMVFYIVNIYPLLESMVRKFESCGQFISIMKKVFSRNAFWGFTKNINLVITNNSENNYLFLYLL